MADDRSRAVELALSQIEKQFGKGSIMRLGSKEAIVPISTTRPRGTPPTPSAASKEIDPVLIVEIGTIASLLPRRMIEPLPNCFSI